MRMYAHWGMGFYMLDAEYYRRQCARLREENEELLEEVLQLREQCGTYAKTCDLPEQRAMAILGVTPGAAKMICRLLDASPKTLAPETLLNHIQSRGSLETIKVYVSRTRKVLAKIGLPSAIQNIRGRGYRINEVNAQAMRILLAIAEAPKTEKSEDPVNNPAILLVQDSTQQNQRAVG